MSGLENYLRQTFALDEKIGGAWKCREGSRQIHIFTYWHLLSTGSGAPLLLLLSTYGSCVPLPHQKEATGVKIDRETYLFVRLPVPVSTGTVLTGTYWKVEKKGKIPCKTDLVPIFYFRYKKNKELPLRGDRQLAVQQGQPVVFYKVTEPVPVPGTYLAPYGAVS